MELRRVASEFVLWWHGHSAFGQQRRYLSPKRVSAGVVLSSLCSRLLLLSHSHCFWSKLRWKCLIFFAEKSRGFIIRYKISMKIGLYCAVKSRRSLSLPIIASPRLFSVMIYFLCWLLPILLSATTANMCGGKRANRHSGVQKVGMNCMDWLIDWLNWTIAEESSIRHRDIWSKFAAESRTGSREVEEADQEWQLEV